jgi:predicted dehydrogenase
MKFLIVGFGSIGRRHFKNLLDLGEKDIIFCRTKKSTLPDDEILGYPVESSLESALNLNPDAVIISNPTAHHLETAIPAAQKGCHILLEKPISHSRDRVDEFVRIINSRDLKVVVGYQFRFHPNLQKIKDLLDQQAIGKPLSFRSHWGEYLPEWHPWEDYRKSYSSRKDLGGGVILTLSHNFDYLGWLFGESRVHSSILGNNSDLEIEAEDTAEIVLEYGNEIIGSIHLNYTQIPRKHTLEIIGTKGSIFWDYYGDSVVVHKIDDAGEITSQAYSSPDGFDRNDLFIEEMKNFIDVIKGRAEPVCSLQDGIAALDLALAAVEKGKRPI